MKMLALAILCLWALIMGMGINSYGLDALWSGLFEESAPESLVGAWLVAVGLPLASLGLYFYGRRHPL
jgi:hypothetical protein